MSNHRLQSVLRVIVAFGLGCCIATTSVGQSDYSGTVINVLESMRILKPFPSENVAHTLKSTDGQVLDALIRYVDLENETAEIFANEQTYQVAFTLFDEDSRQTLKDWGIKHALNRRLSLATAEHNLRPVIISESEPFRFQKPPVGTHWARLGLYSRNKQVGFRIYSAAPVDIEGVDVLIGVRTRRSMRRDESRFYPSDEVAGRYFIFTNLKGQTISGNAFTEFLSDTVIHSFALNQFRGAFRGYVEFVDRFDSYYILVLYKEEIVFGGIYNTASLRVALAHRDRFMAGEENPQFEIINR